MLRRRPRSAGVGRRVNINSNVRSKASATS